MESGSLQHWEINNLISSDFMTSGNSSSLSSQCFSIGPLHPQLSFYRLIHVFISLLNLSTVFSVISQILFFFSHIEHFRHLFVKLLPWTLFPMSFGFHCQKQLSRYFQKSNAMNSQGKLKHS